ncbi:chaperone modulator CbpM [Planktotalea arctica]|uniref:chaperone modulator CbpM n=1 Tax=Planktotalea arctica TaxID=1481893 RepID=UPI00321BC9D8
MSEWFSEDEVVTTVIRLTRTQLVRFVEVELIKPQRTSGGNVFRQIDIARLELLCDLTLDFDLDEIGLGVVISLIDQLHAARQDLAVMAQAIDQLPIQERASVLASLGQSLTVL